MSVTVIWNEGIPRVLGEPAAEWTPPPAVTTRVAGPTPTEAPEALEVAWLPVPGFAGYEATADGRKLRSYRRRGRGGGLADTPTELRPGRDPVGLVRWTLMRDTRQVHLSAGQLAALVRDGTVPSGRGDHSAPPPPPPGYSALPGFPGYYATADGRAVRCHRARGRATGYCAIGRDLKASVKGGSTWFVMVGADGNRHGLTPARIVELLTRTESPSS